MAEYPSIRGLIRRSVVAQAFIGLLLIAVVLLMLVRSLNLVSDQEKDTRALAEIRAATVALLATVGGIDSYARDGTAQQRDQYQAAVADLKQRFKTASARLSGEAARRAAETVKFVEQWEREVLDEVARLVEAGKLKQAQSILLAAENDEAIGVIGLAIADLLNGRVVQQLDTDRRTRNYAFFAAAAALLSVMLMLGSTWFFLMRVRRLVVAPLEDLDSVAARIGHGDFSARVRPVGTSETAAAGKSFNEMVEQLERSIDELRELDTLKDEFVAAVSHELRTPITTIRAYADMHLGGELGEMPAGQRAGLEVIARSAAELSDLIDDLLTLTNIEAGRERVIHPETIDVTAFLAEIDREQRPLYEAAKIDLAFDPEPGLLVRADRLRMRQVLVNLLSNARKFSRPGSNVSVRAGADGTMATFAVADTGIGIDAGDLQHIGERFYRAGNVQEVPGTGLGVAIVRELVELHGGELKIQSKPGRGTTVHFTVPLERAPAG